MPDDTVTYAALPPVLMKMLRTDHPEWDEDVFAAYQARIISMFKRLERKQGFAVVDP